MVTKFLGGFDVAILDFPIRPARSEVVLRLMEKLLEEGPVDLVGISYVALYQDTTCEFGSSMKPPLPAHCSPGEVVQLSLPKES